MKTQEDLQQQLAGNPSFFLAMFNLQQKKLAAKTEETAIEAKQDFYWVDTDIGGDIDDALALSILSILARSGKKIMGVSTTHTNPEQKARIAKMILKELGQEAIPVYAGIGLRPHDNPEVFFRQNPMWPQAIFGVPNPKEGEKAIYSLQGKAYESSYHGFFELEIHSDPSLLTPALINAVKSSNGKLNIIALGPMANIAQTLSEVPELAKHIRIWVMGGWFENSGVVTRPGYNTAVNPEDSHVVFNSGAEIFLVNSQFVQDKKFTITKKEFELFGQSKTKTLLGELLWADWKNWTKGDAFQKKNIADPLTVWLATHNELITGVIHVRIGFPTDENGKLLEEVKGCNMMEQPKPGSASRLISYKQVSEGNFVNLISSLSERQDQDYEKIRKEIVYSLLPIFCPDISPQMFDALESGNSDRPAVL